MKIITTAQIRELDRKTIETHQISGEMLMERAGYGVAQAVDRLCDRYHLERLPILLVAGRGNNGGDAFVAARFLKQWNYEAVVWLCGAARELRGDALTHFNKLKPAKIPVEELPTRADWDRLMESHRQGAGLGFAVVVDGVLGTGLEGPARGPAAGAICLINQLARDSLIVAIDVPSGLNSDTGMAEGDAVRADLTVTMGMAKRGLVMPAALDHVGRLGVLDIGFPSILTDKIESDLELITATDLRPLLPRRARDAHKGAFGHLLMFGGAAGYTGAMALAARAAVRSGAGLVTVVVPRGIAAIVANAAPEAMVHATPETETGSLAAACWPVWRERLNEFSAVLAGPGLTRHQETARLVSHVLVDCSKPLVLDADALNVLAGRPADLRRRNGPLILTPHPGEMARLKGCTTAEIQADRFTAAREAAAQSGATVILKGAGTLVAEAGQNLHINMNGNPGMAAGGMGDVLAGLLGGLLAQGLKPWDAARLAVFLHGLAADEAVCDKTECGLKAGDVIEALPFAFQQISPR